MTQPLRRILAGDHPHVLVSAIDRDDLAPATIDAELVGSSLTERRKEFLDGLAKGRFVWVPRYKKRCAVTKVDRARGRVSVRLGKLVMEVPFDEVTWYEAL